MCKAIECATSLEVFHCMAEEELAQPLKARDYKDPLVVIYEINRSHQERNNSQGNDGRSDVYYIE